MKSNSNPITQNKPQKILIVEDNIVTLGDLELRIGRMGYENIETAVSGEEAIQIAESFKPDLILSDINLGKGITGIDAIEQIKLQQNVPVIYLTAYDDDKTLAKAGITEPYAYLLKPLQERELQISLSIALYKHKIEERLKEANATKDRFISVLGHDLRTPFNAIIGFSSLLLEDIDNLKKDDILEYATAINQAAENTFDFLNNLLAWSRSQTNKIDFAPQKADIEELIKKVYRVTVHAAQHKGIELKLDISDTIIAEIDKEMIETVIRNLVSNAIKFTSKGGSITVMAKTKQNQMQIEVIDTGTGMDAKSTKSLFKIGETQSSVGTQGETGTGFGLLLCKEFIEKHHGSINVESEVGKGSNFKINLPLQQNKNL